MVCRLILVASLLQRDGITGRTLTVDTMTQNCPLAAALLKLVFPSQFIGIFYLMPLLYLLIQFVNSIFFIAMIRYKLKQKQKKKKTHFLLAIAEEEEMSASSLSRKENEEKMTTLIRPSSQTEEEKEAQFEDVDISKSESCANTGFQALIFAYFFIIVLTQ